MTLCPNEIKPHYNCHLLVLSNFRSAQRSLEHLGHFRQCSEVLEKSSETFGSRWDIFGNSGHDKTKISRISLSQVKNWPHYTCILRACISQFLNLTELLNPWVFLYFCCILLLPSMTFASVASDIYHQLWSLSPHPWGLVLKQHSSPEWSSYISVRT